MLTRVSILLLNSGPLTYCHVISFFLLETLISSTGSSRRSSTVQATVQPRLRPLHYHHRSAQTAAPPHHHLRTRPPQIRSRPPLRNRNSTATKTQIRAAPSSPPSPRKAAAFVYATAQPPDRATHQICSHENRSDRRTFADPLQHHLRLRRAITAPPQIANEAPTPSPFQTPEICKPDLCSSITVDVGATNHHKCTCKGDSKQTKRNLDLRK